jgi:hypothetical protein
VSLAAADDTPSIVTKEFVHRATPYQVRFQFSENVQASLTAQDLEVTNLDTGAPFTASSLTYDAGSNVATFVLPAPLANGAYLASLPARSVTDATGNSMASEEALQFFVLTGDVNRDRSVNGTDFALLAGNFGKTGMTYGQGDLNGDATVNGSDFALLAGNFGRTAPAVEITYDSGGFEAPRFTPNQDLAGQDPTSGPWFSVGGVSSAAVQTATVNRGQQSVRVARAASPNGDSRWVATPTTGAAAGVVNVDADMSVTQSTGLTFGPVFGIEAYDGAKFIGSLTLDAATGDVLYQEAGTGFLTETGTVIPRGAYHRYRLSVNLAEKTYSVFVDGTLLHTEGFVDNTAAAFTDAPLATLAATADTVATATGVAFFDNYRVSYVPAVAGPAPAGAIRVSSAPSSTARPHFAPPRATDSSVPVLAGSGKTATPTTSPAAANPSLPAARARTASVPHSRRQVTSPASLIVRSIVPLRGRRRL